MTEQPPSPNSPQPPGVSTLPVTPVGLMDVDGRDAPPPERASGEPLKHTSEEAPKPPRDMAWSTTGLLGPAMCAVVACLVAAFTVPGLETYRPWIEGDPIPFWNIFGRALEGEELEADSKRAAEVETLALEALGDDDGLKFDDAVEKPANTGNELVAYVPHEDDAKRVQQPVELFEGQRLDQFFASLAKSDSGIQDAITRVSHWGDSSIGVDGITSAIRKRMQSRFGDSGHGFHLMAQPSSSYRHKGVAFRTNDKWARCFIIRKCRSDGHYGIGGTTFKSVGGAESWFAPDAKHSAGKVSRFDIWYAGQPNGGNLRLRLDKTEDSVLETTADKLEDRWHAIEVEDGDHQLSIRSTGSGSVRIYGVSLERDVPGVIWDGMSLVGAFTNRMLEFDAEHLGRQLNHRQSSLVVLTFGGNDMIRRMKMADYVGEYRQVVQLIRQARPEMDCLIMAPLDHGERKGNRIASMKVVPRMVEAQRQVAREEGCAFFDTWSAMGGKGSAGRWYNKKPRLIGGDLSHVTNKGQVVIGEMFYRALMAAYVEFRTGGQTAKGKSVEATRIEAKPGAE